MRNLSILLFFAVCVSIFPMNAQNQAYPNAIYAKLNFVDYGTLYDGTFRASEGFEFAYMRNVAPYLNVGIPFKLGLAKLPEKKGNTVTTSFDLIFHLENMRNDARFSPYAFGGAGYFLANTDKSHVQIPFGVGINFRVSKYAFINVQGEFRKALVDDRDNLQLGVGYVYLLHKSDIVKPAPADADKDGTPDAMDKCPELPGPAAAMGCPDQDNDGITDAEDTCPDQSGPLETLGCPDYDNDGVADKDDECPTDAGTLRGCPDADNDGVADSVDECPTEAGGVNGCHDTDYDGVADKMDKCPTVAGIAAFEGCPEAEAKKDSDNDGVLDDVDECPTTAGTLRGCPDSDGDDVADKDDKCPNEVGSVSNNGCPTPKDSDGDGVVDKDDKCPNEAGPASNNGCPKPKDSDGDGVVDKDDKCPNEAGPASNNGCPTPKDTDGDGVIDKDDKCPNEAGPTSNNGCPTPKDSDGDGVVDKDDQCPNQAGPSSNKGCPEPKAKDSDGDGVMDEQDKCPNTPGAKNNAGCPEVKKETKEQLANATKAVQFETAKATLKNESFGVLDEVVGIMRQYPDYTLSISGYTDDIGNDDRNLRLSQDRAKACYDYLVFKGIKQERLRFAGFGELRPIASNDTPEGREINRRVEFELILDK